MIPVWYHRFEELQRHRRLGREFGGYHADLETICAKMWLDRRTLVQSAASGAEVLFHLLVPAYFRLAIKQPFLFDKGLLPLYIKGQIHHSTKCVWFHLPYVPKQVILQDVGRFWPEEYDIITDFNYMIGFWCAAVACTVAIAFPPLAPFEAYLGGTAGACGLGYMRSWYNVFWYEPNRIKPRILGRPFFVAPASEPSGVDEIAG